MPFSAKNEQQLRKAIGENIEVTLMVPETSLVRIVDAVRTIILNWSLKLESDGILGEGLSFTSTEKTAANKNSYNINNFFGSVNNPQIQQEATRTIQISATHQFDINSVKAFIDELTNQIDTLEIKGIEIRELKSEIQTLLAQANSPNPKKTILQESLGSVRRILESAGGEVAVQLLIKLGSLLGVKVS